LPSTRDQTEASNVVRLDREAGIASAADLKQRLLTALSSGLEIRVELDQVADVDVTWVQLLWAARLEAKRSGVAFTVSGQVPEKVSAALHDAGFAPFSASGPGE
jgi:anti-anti-sigma regulatory factor